jgi:iron complex outermembrane receptor protein
VTDEVDYGYFIENQTKFFDRLVIRLGARYDYYIRDQENLDTNDESEIDGNALSPSAGLLFHIIKRDDNLLSVYGNWGKGFNPIYRAVASTEIVEVDPEISESWEAGLRGRFAGGRLAFALVYYNQERKDVVFYNLAIANFDNMGDWRVNGIEASLQLRPIDGMLLYANYTSRAPEMVRTEYNPANEGNDIPLVSRVMYCAGLGYEHSSGLGFNIEDRYYGKSYADEANTIDIPAYNLLDANISYQYKDLTVAVFGRNLTDEEYYSAIFGGVVNGSAFAGQPRTYGVSLTGVF